LRKLDGAGDCVARRLEVAFLQHRQLKQSDVDGGLKGLCVPPFAHSVSREGCDDSPRKIRRLICRTALSIGLPLQMSHGRLKRSTYQR
jgi:hypothetical protein